MSEVPKLRPSEQQKADRLQLQASLTDEQKRAILECFYVEPKLISRAEAEAKLLDWWLRTYSPHRLLALVEPTWETLRNYEFEDRLKQDFGGSWVINEFCPFNGKYCHYGILSGEYLPSPSARGPLPSYLSAEDGDE